MSDSSSRPKFPFSLSDCVVFDVEAYPGPRWLVGFLGLGQDGSLRSFVADGDPETLETVLRQLATKGKTLVGYNSAAYDVPMVRAILGGRDAYETSRAIIEAERLPWNSARGSTCGTARCSRLTTSTSRRGSRREAGSLRSRRSPPTSNGHDFGSCPTRQTRS